MNNAANAVTSAKKKQPTKQTVLVLFCELISHQIEVFL